MATTAYIGLGSNLGDKANIKKPWNCCGKPRHTGKGCLPLQNGTVI